MKILLFLWVSLTLVFITPTFAQQVMEGSKPFLKKADANALTMTYTGQVSSVAAVLKKSLEDASGKKASTRNGLVSLVEVQIPTFSSTALDYYFRVEKPGRGTSDQSEVTMFISAGNENFLTSRSHPDVMDRVKYWMESMQPEVQMYELGLALEAQQKIIDKALKDQDRLHRDSVRLQTTLAQTLANIEENRVANENQRQTIFNEKDRLQAIQGELDLMRNGEMMRRED